MSRSALWRQEANVKERERQALETFQAVIEEGRHRHVRGQIPLYGPDDTFNMNPMLLHNISKSPYFLKCCNKLKEWGALVDEIYYEVKHMEPWTSGASKIPSTAFCLLVRLFTLRCTEKQMNSMLSHPDSPFIRCIGFLYLRYVADPSTLYDWFHPFLYDEERVRIASNPSLPEITVGEYCRNLLTDMNYFSTLLPRLPIQIERDVKVKLLQAEQVEDRAKRNMEQLDVFTIRQRVRALYGDEENPITWYDAVIDRVVKKDDETGEELIRPQFWVTFPEYGNTELVTLGEIDVLDGGADKKRGREWEYGRDHCGGRDNRRRDRGYERDRWEHDRYDDRKKGRGNDVQRDDRPKDVAPVSDEKDLMETVLRRERENVAAKGKQYAHRPPTFKSSLASKNDVDGKRKKSGSDERRELKRDQERAKDLKDASISKSSEKPKEKTPEELAAIEEKRRKLMQRYG